MKILECNLLKNKYKIYLIIKKIINTYSLYMKGTIIAVILTMLIIILYNYNTKNIYKEGFFLRESLNANVPKKKTKKEYSF